MDDIASYDQSNIASLMVTSQQTKTVMSQSQTVGTATHTQSVVGASKIQPSTITGGHKTVTILNQTD